MPVAEPPPLPPVPPLLELPLALLLLLDELVVSPPPAPPAPPPLLDELVTRPELEEPLGPDVVCEVAVPPPPQAEATAPIRTTAANPFCALFKGRFLPRARAYVQSRGASASDRNEKRDGRARRREGARARARCRIPSRRRILAGVRGRTLACATSPPC
jgi:hypothetical protein